MKTRYVILIGLILVGSAGYAHFGTTEDFYPAGKNEFNPKTKRPASAAGGSENVLTAHPGAGVAYAIVVMPKSYLPLLKQFSRSKIAREIKILPAQIQWNDGQPFVVPKEAIYKTTRRQMPPVEKNPSQTRTDGITHRTDKKIALRNAALMLLLQGSLSSKFNYKRHRSSASASSSVHR